jgi:mobilome CxxCx(11)CxxC protein
VTPDLQKHCHDRAFVAYGTTCIFERRAARLKSLRDWITFLGIAVPLTVGSLFLSFNTLPSVFPYILGVAGLVLTLQLVMSLWSLVARWDESYQRAVESMQANTRLFNSWTSLRERPPPDPQIRVGELDAEDQRQEQEDLRRHVTLEDKRFAMRSALYYFKKKCAACGTTPTSMKPGSCDTCGNY